MGVILGSQGGESADRARLFRHALHERELFSDENLARVLDAYPRDRLGVFNMGDGSTAVDTWRAGRADDVSGAALLEAARSGRLWLNARGVDRVAPEYAALRDELFAAVDPLLGEPTDRLRDVGLLISSARAQVFYHLDARLVTLWQLRGRKRVWVYPVAEPYIRAVDIERVVMKETAEECPFDPAWDADAQVFDLEPGDMLTWPLTAPHRVENGDMLNVSLSVECMTASAYRHVNQIYANGLLRRRLGLRPRMSRDRGPASYAKRALTKAAGKVLPPVTQAQINPVSFRIDPAAPHSLLPL